MNSLKTNATSFIGLFVGLGALLILLVLLFSVVRLATSPERGVLPTRVVSSTSTSPLLLEEWKETAEKAVMQTHMALIETVTPEPPPTGPPPTYTPAPFIPGIYEIPDTSFGHWKNWAMSSLWKEIINGERVLVYAGARLDTSGATLDATQGLVAVEIYSTDLSNWSEVEYKAPGKTGMLKIVAASGYRLTLLGQNGATLYFDVPTRQFVDGPTVKIAAPTTTPLPPITPTNTPVYIAPPGYPSPLWNSAAPSPQPYP